MADARSNRLTPQTLGKIMEIAVPLDRTGDERIEDLLEQLRDERNRRTARGQCQPSAVKGSRK